MAHTVHRVSKIIQQTLGRVAGAVGNLQRRKDGENRDRIVRWGKTPLNVKRLPRAGLLVLGDAHAVLPALAQGGLVQYARRASGDVHIDQAHRPADGGVGSCAGAKHVDARVYIQLFGDGAVHDDKLGRAPGAGLAAMVVELGFTHGFKDRHQHRHVFGPATGHNRVDSYLFGGDHPPPGGHHAHHIAGGPPGGRQELPDPLFGGRDHG